MEDDRRTYRTAEQVPPKFTVEELVQWCLDRDLDPRVVTISGGHFVWQRTETDEEMRKRLDWERQREERHREWVREQYVKLFGHSLFGEERP